METALDWLVWLQNFPIGLEHAYAIFTFSAALVGFVARFNPYVRYDGTILNIVVPAVAMFFPIILLACVFLLIVKPIPGDAGLTAISPIKQSPNSKNAIVLLHGWNGSDASWRDFPALLQRDARFSSADVLLVHYPTFMLRRNLTLPQIADWVSKNIDMSVGKKKIYMIAHSMGGVIARKVLLQRRLAGEDGTIKLIVTIGSPHNGANYAELARLLGLSADLTKDLVVGSSFLEDNRIGWREYKKVREKNMATDYCLSSPQDAIVAQQSAIDQCDEFLAYPSGGHLEIVKPRSETDAFYSVPTFALARSMSIEP